jgi:hypothetical protein
MSDKSTITVVGDWVLHEAILQDWHVSLTFPKDALVELAGNEVTIRIPIAIWGRLRSHTSDQERRLGQYPPDLRYEAEQWVTARLAKYALASTESQRSIIAIGGCLIANIDDTPEKQVEDYIAHFTPPVQ